MSVFEIKGRRIGQGEPPLVIAEVGINHEGSLAKAIQMVDDAKKAGCECVKFQCHVIEDEMVPNDVVPGNADVSIWDIMSRCALNETDERTLKDYVDAQGLMYLSTPFSRAAADRLEVFGVDWYKIGSGECNNYPLIRHVARFGRPMVISTGMNDIASIRPTVDIVREYGLPYALLHCTSMYPTPYDKVRLGGLEELAEAFPDAVRPLSELLRTHLPPGQTIDFLTIDAEGFDMEVLRSNDWDAFRPALVLIEALEASLLDLGRHEQCVFMQALGYVPVARTVNTVFYRDTRASK